MILSDMKVAKTITVRQLKRGTPKDRLAPGEALLVKRPGGKEFLVVRETPNLADLHAEIMREIPLKGPDQKTDLAAWHREDKS